MAIKALVIGFGVGVKLILVLSDRDMKLKMECQGVQGLKGLRSGVEK